MDERLANARELIANAHTISVLTGAGISTDSGIPDFRGPRGIWTLDPEAEKITDLQNYIHSETVRQKVIDGYVRYDWGSYKPNAGHYALAKLQDQGKLHSITTQNIDRLHQRSGVDPSKIIELHGYVGGIECIACGEVIEELQQEAAGADSFSVECSCGGLLKPTVTLFGEPLDRERWGKAEYAAAFCDLYLVVGTSLQVWPAADLPEGAYYGDRPIIYVNGSAAPPDLMYDMLELIGSISEILPAIVE